MKPAPPKSDFQPRFRPPGVKQAEHLEPMGSPAADGAKVDAAVKPAAASEPLENVDAKPTPTVAAESSAPGEGPQLLPSAAAATAKTTVPGDLAGREALNAAFTRSKTAASEADYDAIIALCEQGKQPDVSQAYRDYSDQLMGWAYNRRGEVRVKDGREGEALSDFEAAVRLGGAWRAVHNRGVSYAAAGRLPEALADFDRTIELNPRYPNAFLNRAELRYQMGEFAAAVEDYTKALKLGEPDAAAYNGRGHALYRLERFGDALRDYGEAVKLDPTNPEPLINRGDTHSDLGQYGEAAADYRAAVQAAPDNARALQAAAWLMATCPDAHYRDEKLAIDAAQRAIELDGPTFRNLSTLAAAQANAGLFKEAQQTQDKAIASAPKEQVVAGEKMMALYQREIAFRDRPLTSYTTPEEMDEWAEVRPASSDEPVAGRGAPPADRRAHYLTPTGRRPSMPPGQPPRPGQPRQLAPGQPRELPPPQEFRPRPQQVPPQKSRLFAPSGRI